MADGGGIVPGLTLRQVAARAGAALRAAEIEDPMQDVGLLLAHVIGGDRLTLIREPDRCLDSREADRFAALISARAGRAPVSRLVGRRQFWSLDLAISDAVLDPRPDSETVVATALERLPALNDPYQIIDFGTGSGCLLLALLKERPRAWGLGVDISPAAARLAAQNARALGLSNRARFMVGDWGQSLHGAFDLIVANPPYIVSGDIVALQPEVSRHDPVLALDGGADGLDCYRALAPNVARLLKPDGHAVLECGHDQAAALSGIIQAAQLRVENFHRDLAGVERCVSISRG